MDIQVTPSNNTMYQQREWEFKVGNIYQAAIKAFYAYVDELEYFDVLPKWFIVENLQSHKVEKISTELILKLIMLQNLEQKCDDCPFWSQVGEQFQCNHSQGDSILYNDGNFPKDCPLLSIEEFSDKFFYCGQN